MRPTDDDFFPDEELYLRLKPDSFNQAGGQFDSIPLDEVRFPDFSVNRSKYSQPEDVLQPNWLSYGIAAFKVKDIPSPIHHPSEDSIFSFQVEHVPELDNYAHSEVRSYQDGQHLNRKPPRMVRTTFRVLLRQKMVLLKPPESM